MTEDEAAIHAILKQLEDAWNRYDSVAFAAAFAEDANFIQIFGGQLDGRPAIEGSHRVIFGTIYKGSRVTYTLRSIRFLGPGTALVFTHGHLNFTEGGEVREMDTRPTMVMMKEEATWQIVALQNTRISAVPKAAQQAAQLAT